MPKDWGTEKPNITKFTKATPKDHKELLEKLKTLAEKWDYVDKCGVVKINKAIMVDLGWAANNVGKTPDFYIPLKALEVDKADAFVKGLVTKIETKKPIVEQDATTLFASIETAP